jgi:predicted membrane protein
LTAFLGKLIFVVNTQSISHRAVRLDILALFGKVEIVIPEDVGVLSEQTTLFAAAEILGRRGRKLAGREVLRSPAAENQNPRLLLVTRSLFGSVTVRCETN